MARHKRLGLIRDAARSPARCGSIVRAARRCSSKRPIRLTPSLEQEILTAFARVLGADPIVTHWVNPDLIAGFVLRVGDRVTTARCEPGWSTCGRG